MVTSQVATRVATAQATRGAAQVAAAALGIMPALAVGLALGAVAFLPRRRPAAAPFLLPLRAHAELPAGALQRQPLPVLRPSTRAQPASASGVVAAAIGAAAIGLFLARRRPATAARKQSTGAATRAVPGASSSAQPVAAPASSVLTAEDDGSGPDTCQWICLNGLLCERPPTGNGAYCQQHFKIDQQLEAAARSGVVGESKFRPPTQKVEEMRAAAQQQIIAQATKPR